MRYRSLNMVCSTAPTLLKIMPGIHLAFFLAKKVSFWKVPICSSVVHQGNGMDRSLHVKVKVLSYCLTVAAFLCSVLWLYMRWLTARSSSISVVKCQAVRQSEGSLLNCSHHGTELKYKSTCNFACAKGYTLRGSPQIQCLSDGHWSQPIPVCEGKRQRSDYPVIYFGYQCYMHARIHFSYLL